MENKNPNKRSSTGNLDRFLIESNQDRLLYRIGVPHCFWKPKLARLEFHQVELRGKKLTGEGQQRWINSLVKQPPRHRMTHLVVSDPTDNGALYLAYLLMIYRIRSGMKVGVVNCAEAIPDAYADCLVLHNILGSATEARLEKVRDVLVKYAHTEKIVVVGNVKSPEQWMISKLGWYPDLIFKVTDMTRATMLQDIDG